MKRNLLTLMAAGAIVLGGIVMVQAQPGAGGGGGRGHGKRLMLERLPQELNLTSEQQTKVQPIIDQAKPQIAQRQFWHLRSACESRAPISTLFLPKRKQERNHAQGDQYCCDGESGRRDFETRVKIAFEPRRHADQEEQKSKVNQNYADRFF